MSVMFCLIFVYCLLCDVLNKSTAQKGGGGWCVFDLLQLVFERCKNKFSSFCPRGQNSVSTKNTQ